MRTALALALLALAAAPTAQPLAFSLDVPEAGPTPEAVAASEAALDRLAASTLQSVPCPSRGEAAPLTDAQAQAYAARLGLDASPPLGGAGAAPRVQFGGSVLPEADAPAETCFALDPTDEAALWVLQVWAALGWNLEFSALAAEAGVLVPLVLVRLLLLDLAAGYFADDFDRNYLTLNAQIGYLLPLSALVYATLSAGLQAQRQSVNDVSSWEVGPALTVRLIYLASVIRPLVQLTAVYLYSRAILTPSVGIVYGFR